ncbi:MAG: hypothetical protein C0467_22755 [Planctomycetaceae bacterium]|nr:hypothetical protein [Planctomycetaceae bacterium]
MKRPAYSYLRFSTLEQKKGDSTRRQSERPEGVCQEFGWVLQLRTFRDCGVSGRHLKNLKRGDLGIFLAALKAGELEPNPVLILEDLDRLSRAKIMPSVDTARAVLESGCDIYSVIERKLYTKECLNDPMGLMGLIWRFYLAHEESQKKADRSRENWKEKHRQAKEHGVIFTTLCPTWLKIVGRKKVDGRWEGGKFELVPERVELVKRIFRWCIEGVGIQQMMRRLQEQKVPPLRKSWNQKSIWEILKNPQVLGGLPTTIYGGEKLKQGETIIGYYPPIIDQDTFNKAQDAMQSRKTKSGRRGSFVNLFTGLVHYPAHKCSMVLFTKPCSRNKKKFLYRYLGSYLGWKGQFPSANIRYERFENVVLRWLYELTAADVVDSGNETEGIESLKAQRKLLEDRITSVADELKQFDIPVPAVMQKLAEMEARKTELATQIEEKARRQTRPHLEDTQPLIELLKAKTGDDLRDLRELVRQRLRLLIERIDVEINEKRAYLTIRLISGCVRRVWFAMSHDNQEQGLWQAANGGGCSMEDFERLMEKG